MFSHLVSAVAFSMEFILIWKTEVATEDWLDVIYLQVRHNGVAFFLTAVDENWMNWKCSYRTEISGCFHNFIRLLLTVIVIMYKVIIYICICNIYIYILYIYIYIYIYIITSFLFVLYHGFVICQPYIINDTIVFHGYLVKNFFCDA